MSDATFYKWRAKYGDMDASMVSRLKALEDENRRLKEMALSAVMLSKAHTSQLSIRALCVSFSISDTCYSHKPKDSSEKEDIADWLIRLTHNQRNWGFGLCFLYLRNVKQFGWNHKRVYSIYRELSLILRIKPRKRLVRIKQQALAVPEQVNEVWSMDFMHDQLSDGRSIRFFNVIDDFNSETVKVFTANLNR